MRGILERLDSLVRETRYEVENPVVKHGNDFIPNRTTGAFVTQNKHGAVSDDIFLRSTFILGLNEKNQVGRAHAEWDITVQRDVRRNLHKAALSIRALRIQAGLHLHGNYPPYPKNPNAVARISLNRKNIDVLNCVASRMPFGTDYGFGREVWYPIENIIGEDDKEAEVWSLSLEVGKGMLWDIDEISLEMTTKRRRFRSGFWAGVIVGALIGGLFEWMIDRLLEWLQIVLSSPPLA